METNNLLKTLEQQPKEVLKILILTLMEKNILSYQDITDCYVAYLKEVKENISDDYQELKNRVIHIAYSPKKNRTDNIKSILHYLLQKGQINTTVEDIDKMK